MVGEWIVGRGNGPPKLSFTGRNMGEGAVTSLPYSVRLWYLAGRGIPFNATAKFVTIRFYHYIKSKSKLGSEHKAKSGLEMRAESASKSREEIGIENETGNRQGVELRSRL
ncbi:hypothetical protein EVAR_5431_1 [Eumeta japonica]|uniref:Uncharacterized protein n=1 Tax=Eumeta variegata TaxID=151549 RepID=A0A4C1T8U0_EUMVA|nr:hypothetical protein EVAR_5431_1 [Eumeta japonica]